MALLAAGGASPELPRSLITVVIQRLIQA